MRTEPTRHRTSLIALLLGASAAAAHTPALHDLPSEHGDEVSAFIAAHLATIDAADTNEAPPADEPWQAASFNLFAPAVRTRADAQWLFVESDGMPHAPLESTQMKGITSWQQQVPMPQNYTGANAQSRRGEL